MPANDHGAAELSHRQRWGFWPTFYVKVMDGLKRAIGLHLYSVRVASHDAGGAVPALPPGFEVHILTPAEIRNHVDAPRLELPDAFVTGAIARGDVCMGAFKGDQLVGYLWRALRGPVPHTGGWEVTWNPGLVYRYKGFMLPEHRGLHINEVLVKTVDRHLGAQGHTLGVSFIETHNLPELRSMRRKGRRHIGYLGYVQQFGLHLSLRTVGCRRVGLALRRTRRPT